MERPLLSFISFIVNIISIGMVLGQYDCDEAYSCILDTMSDSGIVDCMGSNSCRGSSIVSSSSSIRCQGAFSCYEAVSTYSYLYNHCWAAFSCYGAGSVTSPLEYIYCFGELSCAETGLIDQQRDYYSIQCPGARSCMNSGLMRSDVIFLSGAYAGYGAYMESTTSAVTNYLYAMSTGSGKGATYTCKHSCVIECLGNACDELTVICSGCSSLSYVCYGAQNVLNTMANNGCTDSSLATIDHFIDELGGVSYVLPDLIALDEEYGTIGLSNYRNTYDACNVLGRGVVHCEDYQQCQNAGTIETTVTDPGTICCSGDSSCANSDIITYIDFDNTIEDVAIRCDGHESCLGSSLNATNGGHIYIGAYRAAHANSETNYISTTMEYNIHCTAIDCCYDQNIINGKNVYCNANTACLYATISNIAQDVFVYGVNGATYGEISNINGTVYCGANVACSDTTIDNIGGNVIAYAQGLTSAELSNVAGDVIAFGFQSMYFGELYNASNVVCNGEQSCYNAKIQNIKSLFVYGTDAISGTTIITETQDKADTFIMKIEGSQTEQFDVYCNKTDTCEIYCQASDACSKMSLFCFGQCSVACNEDNGISCPIRGVFDEITTAAPTVMPTKVPTMVPSSRPSDIPTVEPTVVPSSEPTVRPTFGPSLMPTSGPSERPTTEPTMEPSNRPSMLPTVSPSAMPSGSPTVEPSNKPTSEPVHVPTAVPVFEPSNEPSEPSLEPTAKPTAGPTIEPSDKPSVQPTDAPITENPTDSPVSGSGGSSGGNDSNDADEPTSSPSAATSSPTVAAGGGGASGMTDDPTKSPNDVGSGGDSSDSGSDSGSNQNESSSDSEVIDETFYLVLIVCVTIIVVVGMFLLYKKSESKQIKSNYRHEMELAALNRQINSTNVPMMGTAGRGIGDTSGISMKQVYDTSVVNSQNQFDHDNDVSGVGPLGLHVASNDRSADEREFKDDEKDNRETQMKLGGL